MKLKISTKNKTKPNSPVSRPAEKRQLARDYTWNTAASLLTSLSTVVTLAVVTRVAGIAAGGLYSLALAIGQQFQTLGMFEVRTFHITDVEHKFSFGTYLVTRFFTLGAMLLGIIIYCGYTQNTMNVFAAVTLVAALRLFDACEDVFYCELQRAGRLDLAGQASCIRTIATTACFCILVACTKDFISTSIFTFIVSLIALLGAYLPACKNLFSIRPDWNLSPAIRVLQECWPLFLGSFISICLINAPKYALDYYLDASAQGIFSIIYMPALTINLLAVFIYRPLVTRMALQWAQGQHSAFFKGVRSGLSKTILAFAVVEIATLLIGPQLLKLVFGQDVSGYMSSLLILVIGGSFNAANVVLLYALTTMRRQRLIFLGYIVSALTALVAYPLLVPTHTLLGASISYLLTMLVLAVVFLIFLRTSPTSKPAKQK